MKNEKTKYVIINKLKDTSRWKSAATRFTKKAMKVISSWFNVKHS